MTLMGRREIIRVVSVRYARASRQQKSKILDEFTANTGYGRKYAIAVLRKPAVATAPKARRGYVLQTGRIVLQDTAASLCQNEMVRKAYLGET